MAIKINNSTIIDDSRNIVNAGVITATSFVGNVTGNATGLTGSPNITVGVLTATSSFIGSGVTINSSGLNVTGVTTSTSFSGSGANLTSLNASNLSTGTVATARLASGTADSSTFLRGDQTWAAAGGGFANMQVFTSPGTFNVPPTTTKLKVTATGGGGARSPFSYGGNAGGTGIAVFSVPSGSSIPVVIGSAGASSPPGFGPGGTTTFGSYISATGGNVSFNSVGSATFPNPAPTYSSTINVVGGYSFDNPYPGFGVIVSSPGSSYWGSAGAYGAGSGYVNPNFISPGSGIVVVEW